MRRVVSPPQRVEWDIKIEAPHDIYIDWLMHRVEGEIEKSARGKRVVCFKERDVLLGDYNMIDIKRDHLVEQYDWIVTEKTNDTIKIFLIGPFFIGPRFAASKLGFNHEVRSRKVVKAWGEKFSLQ